VAWKNGKPGYANTSFDKSNDQSSYNITTNRVVIAPNPSVGNITATYYTETGGKIHIVVYNKTGLPIYEKDAYAVKGNNNYYINLTKALPGVYFMEITGGTKKSGSNFIIGR
jgi:hypothetical protein